MIDIDLNSKYLYLILDCISCPHIKDEDKKPWSRKLKTMLSDVKEIENMSEVDFFEVISNESWFISWEDKDLWNTIIKKQLILSY